LRTHGLQLKPSGLQENGEGSFKLEISDFFAFLDTSLTVLDPDPYSHYGYGAREAISIQIHMDPDPKHCLKVSEFIIAIRDIGSFVAFLLKGIIEGLRHALIFCGSGSSISSDCKSGSGNTMNTDPLQTRIPFHEKVKRRFFWEIFKLIFPQKWVQLLLVKLDPDPANP